MVILLDVDGVMVDLIEGICKLYGTTPQAIKEKWRIDSNFWEVESITPTLGGTTEGLWEKMESEGPSFWTGLREYPWAKEMYEWCCRAAPTYFVTSPTPFPSCHAGKLEWMKNFTGDPFFKNYLIGSPKFLCAKKENVLVDDSRKNCRAFVEAGGKAVLFPQFYNGNEVEDSWATIKPVLQKMKTDKHMREAVEKVEKWRPDLKLMLGPPPKRVNG